MLPSRHRFSLRKDPDFFKRARRKSTSFLLAFYEQSDSPLQAAVIVAKKTAPLAVDRHLLKRRIQEILQPVVLEKPLKLVIVVKTGALDLSFDQLKSELLQLLSRLV